MIDIIDEPDQPIIKCEHGLHIHEFTWWESDGRGIPLAKVCDSCVKDVLSRYRPEILGYYTQADVDEPIEPID
jgi:hypothetical protein